MENQSLSKNEAIHRLRQAGVNPTQQRVVIAQFLLARPQHLSADAILESMRGSDTHVSKATVYNTLALFAEKGLVREVLVDPTKVFYDSNTGDHYHFFNIDTGELTDVEASQFELPLLPEGTDMDGLDVIIRIKNQV